MADQSLKLLGRKTLLGHFAGMFPIPFNKKSTLVSDCEQVFLLADVERPNMVVLGAFDIQFKNCDYQV